MSQYSIRVIEHLLTDIEYIAGHRDNSPLFRGRARETLRNLIINIDCEISIINLAIGLIRDGNHRFITKRMANKYNYSRYYRYRISDLEESRNKLLRIRDTIKQYSRERGLIG